MPDFSLDLHLIPLFSSLAEKELAAVRAMLETHVLAAGTTVCRQGVLLRREGHEVNLKRVLRLYREEGLKLRSKKRKRIASVQRVRPEATTAVNQMWRAPLGRDLVSDTLSCGRRFRGLNIIDCHSREALCSERWILL